MTMKTIIILMCFVALTPGVFAQNVGIGTATPAGRLSVAHTSTLISPTLLLYDNNAGNFSRLQFQNASGNKFWHIAGYLDNTIDANSRLNFYHSVSGDVLSLSGNGNVGIGTSNPTAKLTLVGNLKLTDGTQGNGKVLTSDASGNATWTSPGSSNTGFSVLMSANSIIANSFNATLPFDNTINTYGFDDASAFNNTSHGYVAPSTGLYSFTVSISLASGTAVSNGFITADVLRNGFYYNTPAVTLNTVAGQPLPSGASTTILLKLIAGDVITVNAHNGSGGSITIAVSNISKTSFAGYRVY